MTACTCLLPDPAVDPQYGIPPWSYAAMRAEERARCPVHNAYAAFLASKRLTVVAAGREVEDAAIHPLLFPFQRDLTRWALRKGRAAIFADTGLGKTFMQLEWARLVTGGSNEDHGSHQSTSNIERTAHKSNAGGLVSGAMEHGSRALIIAPLSVARQTVREGEKIGIRVCYSRDGTPNGPITITNYEMAPLFKASDFGAVVLDESSILKAIDGKTRKHLTKQWAGTPFRLCCTATPAPNDITEIANQAEFLGIMSRAEMMAAFFVHVTDAEAAWQWRLKGHAEQPFYRWLASWGMSVRKPSDLGYSDEGFTLPPLTIEPCWVDANYRPEGSLFHMGLHGIKDRARVRKATLNERVQVAVELVNSRPGQWLVWCGLNAESKALAGLLPDSIEVEGSDAPEAKAEALVKFQRGDTRILITKPRIAGFGMNFQNCNQMAFIGLSDSWEAYYQCIRRSWRFGQTEPVTAYVVLSDAEQDIYTNVQRKETEANRMRENLIEHVAEYERQEIGGVDNDWTYETAEQSSDEWRMLLGDSCERLTELASESIDLSVFSPPFLSLYTYSPTERDVGNSKTEAEFYRHFGIIIAELLRITKPGRNCCVHVSQVSTTLATDGLIGLRDFRGRVIRQFVDQGWTYYGEVAIDKDPQAQAIRTHSKGLLFVQLHKDSLASRPALADYILIFQKPGVNPIPVSPDISNDEWIEWARPIWYGIRESETLNAAEGRDQKDEKHIAPLQLGTIERCVRLWSNPGELVLSPFAGIGSEGYVAVKHGRRFVGIELKRSYFDAACINLARAEESVTRRLL